MCGIFFLGGGGRGCVFQIFKVFLFLCVCLNFIILCYVCFFILFWEEQVVE